MGVIWVSFFGLLSAITDLFIIGILLNSIIGLTLGTFFIKEKINSMRVFGVGCGFAIFFQLIVSFSIVISDQRPSGLWILSYLVGVLFCTGIVSLVVFGVMLPRKYPLNEYIYCGMFLYVAIWIVPISVILCLGFCLSIFKK